LPLLKKSKYHFSTKERNQKKKEEEERQEEEEVKIFRRTQHFFLGNRIAFCGGFVVGPCYVFILPTSLVVLVQVPFRLGVREKRTEGDHQFRQNNIADRLR